MNVKACAAESGIVPEPLSEEHEISTTQNHRHRNLTVAEQRDLKRCEAAMKASAAAFWQFCSALLEIKQRKLYRENFKTFEAYCQQKWGMKRAHAYRLADAADICRKMSPMGDILMPENERQLRPLRGLPPAQARGAWARAAEKAGEHKITGALVKEAVVEMKGRATSRPAEREYWQLRVKPLLREALLQAERGEKAAIRLTIERVLLLLHVGERPHAEGEEMPDS